VSHVLEHIKIQISEGVDYALETLPTFQTPEHLFYYLKDRVTYMNDPETIELIMTMQTMLTGTRTGVPGGGDCDDFTITSVASLISQGWEDIEIILAGRNAKNPVHIYCRVLFQGEWFVFDLTNEQFNEERKYNFYQELEFCL